LFRRLKRLFEKRSTLAQPASWLSEALGAMPTLSGESISPDKALTLSSYYAAIRAVSEDVGKLPLILYRRLERGKSRATKHPVYRLIHDEPNREMSSMTLRETLTLHAIGWGGGFAEIVRSNGRPVALWPLDPKRVRIDRDSTKQVIYRVQPAEGGEVVLPARDVLHIHGLGFDGLTGYSVAKLARESIGLGLALEKSGAALFGNGSLPGGVLEHPGPKGLSANAMANMREGWEKIHKGTEKSHRIAILQEGTKYQSIAVPNKDAQWIEARKFMVCELARWLRIPPHKLGDLERATFSNIEQQSIEYVTDCLMPWLKRWEHEIARKLLPKNGSLFAEHLVDGLLRGDTPGRFSAYQVAINSGWMSRNEARALENLNPLDGLDEMLKPMNLGPVGGDQATETE